MKSLALIDDGDASTLAGDISGKRSVRWRSAVVFLTLGVLGVALRWWVLVSPLGELNADEAYTGLQSLGVLDGRFPVVVDGNRYTAVLECYILAPILWLVGPRIAVLKIMAIVIWAGASLITWRAGRAAGGAKAGAVAGVLMWIAPGALMTVSTLAYVGYGLGMGVSAGALWAAAKLMDAKEPTRRAALIFGGTAGLGFYVHPMFVAVLLPFTICVAIGCRKHWRLVFPAAVAGAVVANLPFLAWNAVNGWPSLTVQNGLPGTYADRIRAFVSRLFPRVFGQRDQAMEWILGRPTGLVVFGAVGAMVLAGALGGARLSPRPSRFLVPAALVGVLPLMALFSPLIYAIDGRYGVVAFPILAICLGQFFARITNTLPKATLVVSVLGAIAWLGLIVLPTAFADADIGGYSNEASLELLNVLEERGVTAVNGSYWRVLTVEYLSDRAIRGAVSAPYPVRFPERQREVEALPPEQVTFLYAPWDAEATHRLPLPIECYTRMIVATTTIYLPDRGC